MKNNPTSLVNLRDVGAASSLLRRGILFRSDAPHPGDNHAYDVEWPPRTVIDLRSPSERDDTHPLAGVANVIQAPLVGDVIAQSTDAITLNDLYLAFTSPPASQFLVDAIEAIATAPAPVLVHCAAGKDRTGVAVAVTLKLLGVSDDEIVLDYSLSETAMPQILSRWQERRRRMKLPDELPELDQSHLRSTDTTMRTFLAALEAHAGGTRGWYLAAGGSTRTLEGLHNRFVGAEIDETMPAMSPTSGVSHEEVEPPALPDPELIAYGDAPIQSADFWSAQSVEPAPLIMFVHSGGFQQGDKSDDIIGWMVKHFNQLGHAFASMNYRLIPEGTVEKAAQDVAEALAYFVEHATEWNIDPNRLVLIGHGAGGTLVSLVGTDKRYLEVAGLTLASVTGVVSIDCALFDIPSRMRDDGPPLMHEMYRAAFGTEERRQRALSPVHQATQLNTTHFLLISTQGTPGETQAQIFARALIANATTVETIVVPTGPQGHDEIVRRLGSPGVAQTGAVDDWLSRVFTAARV